MSEPVPAETGLLTPRRLVVQVLGFVVGIALLGWCISIAVRGGDWSRIVEAPPLLIAGLIACSLVSFFVNGTIFWLVIRPVQRLGFADMQWLNLVTGVLNYAPIRAGLVARVAYHIRVDRMGLLQLGAWFTALAYTLALALGACFAATIVWPHFDAVWGLLLAGQIVLGGLLTWTLMGQSVVVRFGRGMDRMLREPSCLAGALILRLVDISAFVGRMACAAAIIGLSLDASDILLLGFASLALSLNPLGRTGFREMSVAFVASRLISPEFGGGSLEGGMAQLALVESAGEAIAIIPLGTAALFWYRKRWSAAGRAAAASPAEPAPQQ